MAKAGQGEFSMNTGQCLLLKHVWAAVPILCRKDWRAPCGQRLTGTRESTSVHLCRDGFVGHEVLELHWVPHALS